MLTLLPKGAQTKFNKIFLLEDFFHLPPVSLTPVVHLEPRMSPRIFEKNRNDRKGILRCLGETDSSKKTRSRKSRDTVPLRTGSSRFCNTVQYFLLKKATLVEILMV